MHPKEKMSAKIPSAKASSGVAGIQLASKREFAINAGFEAETAKHPDFN